MAVNGTFNMEPYQKLEKEYTKFVGSKFAVSVSSGTAALHLALLALRIGPGDEVIVPDFTMAAVPFAVSYTGATPVFGDVYIDTYGLRLDEIVRLITHKTKAVIIAHTYGRINQSISTIVRLLHSKGIAVIEDACEAQGSVYKSDADITCYSFYKNKIIAAEEGGIVTTNHEKYAQRIKYLKNMAFSAKHDYFHKEIGYNYRMTNAMAQMALESLRKYDANNHTRKNIESFYMRRLPTQPRDAVWFYEVRVKNKQEILKKIPKSREAFKPLSSFPMYGGGKGLPEARALSKSLILLPIGNVTPREINKICSLVKL